MTALPGNRTYGRLTVALAARCSSIESLFQIRPGSFTPPPKVDSGFVRLIPHDPGIVPEELFPAFDKIVAQASPVAPG